MNNKRQIRLVISLFSIAALIFAIQGLISIKKDPDFGSVDTKGWIAGIERTEKGQRAIIIKPDGEIEVSPDHLEKSFDSSLRWQPDGQRLYFMSDRKGKARNLYRWNLATNRVQKRTLSKRPKSNPQFHKPNSACKTSSCLLISSAKVLEFESHSGSTPQVLPPISGNGVNTAKLIAIYDALGENFIKAQWSQDNSWIIATIRKKNLSQVLIAQNMKSADQAPIVLLKGRNIDFDVNNQGGIAATFTDKNDEHFLATTQLHKIALKQPIDLQKIMASTSAPFSKPKFDYTNSKIAFLQKGKVLSLSMKSKSEDFYVVSGEDVVDFSWSADSKNIIYIEDNRIFRTLWNKNDPEAIAQDLDLTEIACSPQV